MSFYGEISLIDLVLRNSSIAAAVEGHLYVCRFRMILDMIIA